MNLHIYSPLIFDEQFESIQRYNIVSSTNYSGKIESICVELQLDVTNSREFWVKPIGLGK